MTERLELAKQRIREIKTEKEGLMQYQTFFSDIAQFLDMCLTLGEEIKENGTFLSGTTEELQKQNDRLYEAVLPERYGSSFANPAVCAEHFGEEMGKLLCAFYAEMHSIIPFVFEGNTEALLIRLELFLEVHAFFVCCLSEDKREPDVKELHDILYWYVSDYSDAETERRIREQLDPSCSFAADIIRNADLEDLRYLYAFGERITSNEIKTAAFLNSLPEEEIIKIASVFTEGFRRGFEVAKKDLSKKKTVNIRFRLGFERVIKIAAEQFGQMGLQPVLYRAGTDIFSRRSVKIGYYGGVDNPQFDYDHKEDMALFLDGHLVTRRLECLSAAYELYKTEASLLAGPACMEVFGEEIFEPVAKKENPRYSESQQKLVVDYTSQSGVITNTYIKREERSFTIIAFPVPEIGENFPEIFREVVALNTLDASLYQEMQQKIIDVLDRAEYCHIKGGNGNCTDLRVQLVPLSDPEKETKFENCVADVNIPVGEVFTSPVLKGTNGVLHVKKVYLNDYEYKNIMLTFSNGEVTEYNCDNFSDPEENKAFIKENLLFHHKTLPMGEFAIGTNTTAFVMAEKYGIARMLPILIAEKMGPHFAIGDTCYSHEEEVRLFNPDGKEIVAKENDYSRKRKEDPKGAYFNCHTDITIPYDELESLTAVTSEGEELPIIRNGRFVVCGCEALNAPFVK